MRLINYILGLFDNRIVENKYQKSIFKEYEVDWLRVIPFILIHLAIFTVFLVGFSYIALLVFLLMYSIRMFAITGFYHRYFSHKAFKTSRIMQFIFAVIGASAVQRGPIWWAAHHRGHHVHSDTEQDKHSPKSHGFFWSHMGWFLSKANFLTHQKFVKELIRFPELRLIRSIRYINSHFYLYWSLLFRSVLRIKLSTIVDRWMAAGRLGLYPINCIALSHNLLSQLSCSYMGEKTL